MMKLKNKLSHHSSNVKSISMLDTKKRSFLKTVSWKIIATAITLFTIYYFTGTFRSSVKITVVAAVIGLIAFYIHERVWNRVKWGRIN